MRKNCRIKTVKILLIPLLVSVVFFALEKGIVQAVTSESINFQGKIVRNDAGYEGLNVTAGSPSCVVDGASNDTCDFRALYYTASSAGTLLLTEDFTNVEIGEYGGVFNLSLGTGSITTTAQCRDGTCNTLLELISEFDDVYVELQFAPNGSSLTETFSRMPLEANAYSMFSKYAGGASDAFKFSQSISSATTSSPVEGMVYYDTGSNALKLYDGSDWVDLATGGSSLWSSESIAAWTWAQFMESTGIGTLDPFSADTTTMRASINGSDAKTGLSVYSSFNSTTDWPLVSFKADGSSFTGSILELVQDGTGAILQGYKGSNEVFSFDNAGDLHLASDGVMYFETFASDPSTGLSPGTGEGCIFSYGGDIYWDSDCDSTGEELLNGATGSTLWTDFGDFTYLTSASDDLILGGSTVATATFVFDVDASGGAFFEIDSADNSSRLFTIDDEGNVGIGVSAPSAKLEIGGASSTIANSAGNITITPAAYLILSTGRFGIGDTTPTHTIDVNGTYGINDTQVLAIRGGVGNLFVGNGGAGAGTTDEKNTSIGIDSLYSLNNSDADANVAVGYQALYSNTSGGGNLAIGHQTLYSNTSGAVNLAFGDSALYANTSGEFNIGIGRTAGFFNQNGGYNTFIGTAAGQGTGTYTISDYNVIIGSYAGYSLSTDMDNNVIIGKDAGYNIGGDGNIFIGYQAGYNETGANKLYIDNSNTASPLIGGDFSSNYVNINGNLGIDITSPLQELHVYNGTENADVRIQGAGSSEYVDMFSGGASFGLWGSSGTNPFVIATNSSERFRITSDGKVGIGMDAPSYTLDVLGTARISETVADSTGELWIEGTGNDIAAYLRLVDTDTDIAWILQNRADDSNEFRLVNYDGTNWTRPFVIQDSAPSDSLFISSAGNIGIGTASPGAQLQIVESGATTSAGYGYEQLFIANDVLANYNPMITILTDDSSATWDYFIRMRSNEDGTADDEFLFRTTGTANADGSWSGGGADVAELYYIAGEAEPGDLVSIWENSENIGKTLTKSSGIPYNQKVVGVVSTNPGLVAGAGNIDGDSSNEDRQPVALAGRVPIKVSLENGPIKRGDLLTSSSAPGVAMKATSAGHTIGRAMEDYDGSVQLSAGTRVVEQERLDLTPENKPLPVPQSGVGKIMVYISFGYSEGDSLRNAVRGESKRALTEEGWYRVAQTNEEDATGTIKLTSHKLGSYQSVELEAIKRSNGDNSIDISKNVSFYEKIFSQVRFVTESGVTYLEVYIEGGDNNVSSSIVDTLGWSAIDFARNSSSEDSEIYSLSGISFSVDDTLTVSNNLMKVTGDIISNNQSNLGDSNGRWNNIYANGIIKLGNSGSEGSIRYNVDKHQLEFSNNGTEWLSLGDLKSQNVLSPEYPGAVLYGDGTDNYGTMISDADDVNSQYLNYYQWSSDLSSLQDYDILVRVTLPDDFVSWNEDGITVDFVTENAASVDNNRLDVYLYGTETNQSTDAQSTENISKLAGQWQRTTLKGSDIDKCNSSGDTCVLRIVMSSKDSYFVKVGDITLNYNRSL